MPLEISAPTTLHTSEEAAGFVGVKHSTFRGYLRRELVKSDLRVGDQHLFTTETLERFRSWLRENKPRPGNPNWIGKGQSANARAPEVTMMPPDSPASSRRAGNRTRTVRRRSSRTADIVLRPSPADLKEFPADSRERYAILSSKGWRTSSWPTGFLRMARYQLELLAEGTSAIGYHFPKTGVPVPYEMTLEGFVNPPPGYTRNGEKVARRGAPSNKRVRGKARKDPLDEFQRTLPRRTPTDLARLAQEQGVRPATRPEELLGNVWPEDESVDEFVETYRKWRKGLA